MVLIEEPLDSEKVIGYFVEEKRFLAKKYGTVTYDFADSSIFSEFSLDKISEEVKLLNRLELIATYNQMYIQLKKGFAKSLTPDAIAKSGVLQGRYISPNPDIEVIETQDGVTFKNPKENETIVDNY